MLITCTSCGTSMRTPDDAAGKRVKCPKCATIITVPTAEPATSADPNETGVSSVPLPPPPAAGPAPVDTDVTAKPPAPPPLPKAGDDAPRRGRDWGDDDDDDYDEDDLDVRNRRRRPQAVNSMAMTSMILGIVSVSSCFVMICCCGLLGAGSIATITGILAVIFGAISRVPGSESQSLTGLICGGIGAVLGMIEAVAGFTVLAHFGFFQGF